MERERRKPASHWRGWARLGLAWLLLAGSGARGSIDLRLPEAALVGGVALGASTRGREPMSAVDAMDWVRQAGVQVMEVYVGQALQPTDPGAVLDEAMTEEQLGMLMRKVSTSSVRLIAMRVRFGNNATANSRIFEWADRLGVRVLVGDPPPEQFDHLEKMIRKFNIAVGLPTGPRSSTGRPDWTDPKVVMTALRGREQRFGVVVNVLNVVRAGGDPVKVVTELRTRLLGVQFCDYQATGATARGVPFGTGAFELRRMLTALDVMHFGGYLVYDPPGDGPEFKDDLSKAVDYVRREMAGIRRDNLLRFASREASAAAGLGYHVMMLGEVSEPTALQPVPGGGYWLAGRRGEIWSWSSAQPVPVQVGRLPVNTQGERGLYEFVLDPRFATNGHLYVYRAPMVAVGDSNRVSRFTATRDGSQWRIPIESEKVLLELPSAAHGRVQGGGLLLHPGDGHLYVGTGDNHLPEETPRIFDDPQTSAQNPADLRGKILRIDVSGGVPADNPFVGTAGARPEVYALGLRNPFTLTVDPGTGQVYAGDVGYDRREDWEEINRIRAGANYGWPRCDGRNRDTLAATPCPIAGAEAPWFGYPHDSAASVLVGPFVRGGPPRGWPSRFGHGLVYADFSRRTIRFAQVDAVRGVVTNTVPLVTGLAGGALGMVLTEEGDLVFVEYAGWLAGSPRDRLSRVSPEAATGTGAGPAR